MKNLIRWFSMAVLAILSTSAGQVKGAAMINILEFSDGVKATLSGNINLNATGGLVGSGFLVVNGISASVGSISLGTTIASIEAYSVNIPWTPFGSPVSNSWTTSSGSAFGLIVDPVLGLLVPRLLVPQGYQSLAPLNATATANGATFSSLGFTPGTYVSTFSNRNVSDTVTVVIGAAPVPEPASFAIFGGLSALGSLIGVARRKRALAS